MENAQVTRKTQIRDKKTAGHLKELALIRRLTSRAMRELERAMNGKDASGTNSRMWDDKESLLGVLVKLAQLQMKLIPLEQDLLQEAEMRNTAQPTQKRLSEEDWRLVAQAARERFSDVES